MLPADNRGGVIVDPSGNVFLLGWFQSTGAFSSIKDIAVGPRGDVVFVGDYQYTLTLGSNVYTADVADGFVADFSPAGALRWSHSFGANLSGFSLIAQGVATDPLGRAYVTGGLAGTVDFGGGPVATAGGSYDGFLAVFFP